MAIIVMFALMSLETQHSYVSQALLINQKKAQTQFQTLLTHKKNNAETLSAYLESISETEQGLQKEFLENFSSNQIDIHLMGLFENLSGLYSFNNDLTQAELAIVQRLHLQATARDEPAYDIYCDPECFMFGVIPFLPIEGQDRYLLFKQSISDLLVDFDFTTGAQVGVISRKIRLDDSSRRLSDSSYSLLSYADFKNSKQILDDVFSQPKTIFNLFQGEIVRTQVNGNEYAVYVISPIDELNESYLLITEDITEVIDRVRKLLLKNIIIGFILLVAIAVFILRFYIRDARKFSDIRNSLPLLSQKQYDNFRSYIASKRDHKFFKDETEEIMDELIATANRLEHYGQDKDIAESANREKSRFLANMSHELRTPLHAVISFSRLAMKREVDAKTHHYLENIDISAKRLTAIVDDLLDLAKLEAGKMVADFRENDLTKIVSEQLRSLHSLIGNKALNVIFNDQPEMVFYFDKKLITQVVVNLLSNAIKFSSEGGKLKISIKIDEGEYQDGRQNMVELMVADQGIGIPADELNEIFDSFIQSSKHMTQSGGTGLGLSICKEIVQLHHGKIWAESPVNDPDMIHKDGQMCGTALKVLLPLNPSI